MSKYLGLVGTNGAGKSSVCEYLIQKGYSVISLSDVVRAEASKKNLSLTRDNLVKTGNELKAEFGQDILAKRSYEKAQALNANLVVFDSIRNLSEITFLKAQQVKIIGIDASLKVRYQRISARKRETDQIDFDTFKAHDERENSGQSSGQNISGSLKECAIIINNESTLEELHHKIDQYLINQNI